MWPRKAFPLDSHGGRPQPSEREDRRVRHVSVPLSVKPPCGDRRGSRCSAVARLAEDVARFAPRSPSREKLANPEPLGGSLLWEGVLGPGTEEAAWPASEPPGQRPPSRCSRRRLSQSVLRQEPPLPPAPAPGLRAWLPHAALCPTTVTGPGRAVCVLAVPPTRLPGRRDPRPGDSFSRCCLRRGPGTKPF